ARLAAEGDGPDLLMALAVLRASTPRFTHPLAPRADRPTAMLADLSTRVGTDVGGRLGAGIGAVLGPIGSMLGRYLGGMAGSMSGKAVAAQSLPEGIAAPLRETEKALARLGEAAASEEFARAARRPAEAVLELGQEVEAGREVRSRRLRERIWPT